MPSSSVPLKILDIAQKLSFYGLFIIFVAALVGNTLNIFVFTKVKLFKGNRCTYYLTVESVIGIYVFIQTCILQIFQLMYQTDPANISPFFCKIKTTLNQSLRLLIDFIVCFEALDQYLSTNPRLYFRQMSTLKLARYSIIVASILCIMQTIPYIIFYNVVSPFGCIIINEGLKYYYSFVYYIFLNGFLPISISTVFSLLAYRNVRHIIRRQIPIQRRKLDQQLTAMIFVRVIMFVAILLPYTFYRIYAVKNIAYPVGSLQYATVQLITTIVALIMICNNALNFYIFAATSSRFRHQVKHLFMKVWWPSLRQWFNSTENRVHALNIIPNERSTGLES
ncbi:unnamed protein product [Rotaria sp. Silwood2]|nr:unnamed protein product [Rotaria sp. Silwood2]CAF2956092.1 unnamed protein product [Rotaria sp. Silwood2]CAF3326512.1 unnamed protein product [Rotaria sp. Silwood2]CAF4473800.1 unnamed protein product [Rotaria sp. Silwood2]CAF4507042.1 unnamed protein product [Rotaria sp. Silwood2]